MISTNLSKKIKVVVLQGKQGPKGDSADVVDNLTSTDTDKALSANQGKVLDSKKVDKVSGKGLSSNDYTDSDKAAVDCIEYNSDDDELKVSKMLSMPNGAYILGNNFNVATGNVVVSNGDVQVSVASTVHKLSKKADKANSNGGFSGGESAASTYGGAIGKYANSTLGGAIGNDANATEGGAVGNSSWAVKGGAIGAETYAGDGFSGGYQAQTGTDSDGNYIDAIQLGTGTNTGAKTLQVYNYQLMDASGYVPNERLREISTGAVTSLLLKDRLEKQMLSSDTASLTLTTPATISNSYECAFSFKSGVTATTLVYAATPITWRGTDCDSDGDFTPQANVSYEVSIKFLGKDADNNPVVVARVGAF